jgi:hypothetical protein
VSFRATAYLPVRQRTREPLGALGRTSDVGEGERDARVGDLRLVSAGTYRAKPPASAGTYRAKPPA